MFFSYTQMANKKKKTHNRSFEFERDSNVHISFSVEINIFLFNIFKSNLRTTVNKIFNKTF